MLKHTLTLFLAAAAGPAMSQSLDLQGGQLSMLDANSDGNVTREEFQIFVDNAFQQLDANGDGSLGAAELATLMPPEAIAELDGDGDGSVSDEEFSARMGVDFDTADIDGDGVLN